MSKNWRHSKAFRSAALLTAALQVVFPPFAHANSQPQIVVDGRTSTSLNIQGSTTDIRTNTVFGQTGLNSFSRFNVNRGNTVNMHLPDGTSALVNMVHNEQTVIDGILNSYRAQQIGGDIYFLNPHGVMVGSTGVLNVGSITMSTPTPDFMQRLLSGNQVVSEPHLVQVLDNNMPLSKSGVIDIRGRINALSHAALKRSR